MLATNILVTNIPMAGMRRNLAGSHPGPGEPGQPWAPGHGSGKRRTAGAPGHEGLAAWGPGEPCPACRPHRPPVSAGHLAAVTEDAGDGAPGLLALLAKVTDPRHRRVRATAWR
jgi:hypothetical protein